MVGRIPSFPHIPLDQYENFAIVRETYRLLPRYCLSPFLPVSTFLSTLTICFNPHFASSISCYSDSYRYTWSSTYHFINFTLENVFMNKWLKMCVLVIALATHFQLARAFPYESNHSGIVYSAQHFLQSQRDAAYNININFNSFGA